MAKAKTSKFPKSLEFALIIATTCCLFVIFQCVECNKKLAQVAVPATPMNKEHRMAAAAAAAMASRSHSHSHSSKDSESESEEDFGASPPEITGIKGLASAGITYAKSTNSVPKCLGHDLRLEKIIQVTRHCESETGEGKNETETVVTARSLCFTACMFRYLGLIGEDLMFTSNIDTVVLDIFPAIAQIQAKRALRLCAKQTVLPLSKADNCTSYGFVKGCILKSVQQICSGEFYS